MHRCVSGQSCLLSSITKAAPPSRLGLGRFVPLKNVDYLNSGLYSCRLEGQEEIHKHEAPAIGCAGPQSSACDPGVCSLPACRLRSPQRRALQPRLKPAEWAASLWATLHRPRGICEAGGTDTNMQLTLPMVLRTDSPLSLTPGCRVFCRHWADPDRLAVSFQLG